MDIIWTIIIGFFVGLIARFLKPGDDKMGWIMTTLLGIGGAFVGTFLGRGLGLYAPHEPAGFLASLVGAILLLILVQMFTSRQRKSIG
jgi:uncharacterized membrane protein YeaQ/YmgE (transglycosylase-associated protein family)